MTSEPAGKDALTVERALALVEQARLDELSEGLTEADCNISADYVLASAYRRQQSENARLRLSLERLRNRHEYHSVSWSAATSRAHSRCVNDIIRFIAGETPPEPGTEKP